MSQKSVPKKGYKMVPWYFGKEIEIPEEWDCLPFEKYEKIASPHGVNVNERGAKRYAPIMTSRGCPFKCAYCHISQEKDNPSIFGNIGDLRTHSIDRVIKEIDHLVSLKVKKLFFEDDSLLADKDRVKTIFKKTKNRKLSIANVNGVNLVHFFNTHDRSGWIDGKFDIDTEYLEILKDSGFDQIVFPVESAAKRILKLYATNKVNLDRMDLPLLMKKMTNLGIQAPVNMMIGFHNLFLQMMYNKMTNRLLHADMMEVYKEFFAPKVYKNLRILETVFLNPRKGGNYQLLQQVFNERKQETQAPSVFDL